MAKIVSIVHGTRNGALRASTEKHLQLDQMSDRNDRRYFVAAHHWHPQLVARNENTSRQFSTLIDRSEASQYGVSYVKSSNMFSSVTHNLDSAKLPKRQKRKNNRLVHTWDIL